MAKNARDPGETQREPEQTKNRRKSKALFCDLSDFYLLIDILYLENIKRKQELIVISICIYETIRKRVLHQQSLAAMPRSIRQK